MSSDGYFDGDDLDDAAFEELDAIEAAAFVPPASSSHEEKSSLSSRPAPAVQEDSFYDLTLDIDEDDLQMIDQLVENIYYGKAQAVPGPRRVTHQTTLFGDVLPPSTSTQPPRSQRAKSTHRNQFGRNAPKTKVWDQTAFAKTGLKSGKSKGKGKALCEEDDPNEEEVEFEQFPAPFVPGEPLTSHPPPMKLTPDLLEAKHWIYPLNRPKRDYQYNIVKRCLFENTIVALPTGLGKTFIAGVIMLNYYRWFSDGKVVFVAPTKPLVAQQIEACHQTCGIPGCDAAELTGQIPKSTRGRLWREKRVFYMTPQTLVNDLTSENCDVRDIVLLVIDEAHRATGDYAYNQVVRFLMAKNPHFRILALTATPGGNPEAVQNLIDGLHISHIEIRDENSLDLKQYIHHKKIEQHIISMTDDVNKVKELLSALMDKDLKQLRQRGVLWGSPDPVKFHPYSAQARMSQLTKEQRWAYIPLSRLASLARAMGYLIEGTMGMCHTYLQDLARPGNDEPASGPGNSASTKKTLASDAKFQAVLREIDAQRDRGFTIHPKMDLLKTLVIQHFAQQLPGREENASNETRVMIFVTFREAVNEIVEALNLERPLVRAHKFIGQGTDKQGRKGLAQKEQLDVIERFKTGEFNVLVATSIGEEGLDIGEVDLIVCYDAQKTPIRMLQRLGRTGRKRAGVVHVLLAEGREELNLEKAKDTYKEVQGAILRGEQLELYSDVPRLLPDHIKPECLEKAMEIQEYVRDEGRKKLVKGPRSPTIGTKRKRNDDVSRNIPAGASTGFISVADLLVKVPKKQKKVAARPKRDFDLAGEDDDTDMDIESGLVSALPRRTKSSVPSSSKQPDKSKLRRSKTSLPGGNKKKTLKMPVEPSSSEFSSKGIDDMDDLNIERDIVMPPSRPVATRRPISSDPVDTPSPYSSNKVLDLTDSEHDVLPPYVADAIDTEPDQSMAWLVDEDEDPNFEIVESSPITNRNTATKFMATGLQPDLPDQSIEFIRVSRPQMTGPSTPHDELIDFVEASGAISTGHASAHVFELFSSPVPTRAATALNQPTEFVAGSSVWKEQSPSSPSGNTSSSPVKPTKGRRRGGSDTAMPPPNLTKRSPLSSSEKELEPSFPVRPQTRRRFFVNSPDIEASSPPRRCLRRLESPGCQNRSRRKRALRTPVNARSNPLFDFEADHSGNEVSEGTSGPEEEEDESDRMFVQEVPETQISPSYDQRLAYRQSLFTQAPAGAKFVPAFKNGPLRHGMFGVGTMSRSRPVVSSSPPREDEVPDEYVMGSFVVDDDAEISYLSEG